MGALNPNVPSSKASEIRSILSVSLSAGVYSLGTTSDIPDSSWYIGVFRRTWNLDPGTLRTDGILGYFPQVPTTHQVLKGCRWTLFVGRIVVNRTPHSPKILLKNDLFGSAEMGHVLGYGDRRQNSDYHHDDQQLHKGEAQLPAISSPPTETPPILRGMIRVCQSTHPLTPISNPPVSNLLSLEPFPERGGISSVSNHQMDSPR